MMTMFRFGFTHFLKYQHRWAKDKHHLRICVKSRQVGLSYVDGYDSVVKAATKGGKDVWIMSRDEIQSQQYFINCKRWARVLGHAASDLGEQLFTSASGKPVKVRVLTFASGHSIYALSSNPDAIVGKSGHVKLDEFALHRDQRTLYAVAKPVIQWGGSLSIISTHRGHGTVFNQILMDIKERGNPMGWSLHEIPIETAVEQGLVEKINSVAGRHETREAWLARQRAECIDEEQWFQEYCCKPADENSAFFSYDMLNGCEEHNLRVMTLDEFIEYAEGHPSAIFYLGVDVARKQHLCVLDLGQKIGDVTWDCVRIELKDQPFSEIKSQLYRLLRLPQLKRACIDATGLGMQLAEEAQADFRYKVEPITFSAEVKANLAFGLQREFEERKLRIVSDEKLRADLRGLKKEVTVAGNIRFIGESEDSHCDRTWALALRQHAARYRPTIGARCG